MGMQLRFSCQRYHLPIIPSLLSSPSPASQFPFSSCSYPVLFGKNISDSNKKKKKGIVIWERKASIGSNRNKASVVIVASSNVAASPLWDGWKPQKGAPSLSLSDVLWPSAGEQLTLLSLTTQSFFFFFQSLFPNSLIYHLRNNKWVAGAFAAMAILGRLDQLLASKGVSMTIAPMGAVCAVLFATPSSPAARVRSLSLSLSL